MMYSEFIEGTGCKVNDHNYKVFCNLEAMYMNTDMSKAEIYEYGKKLVDNSKSEAELRVEAECKREIEELKSDIAWHQKVIDDCKNSIEFWMGVDEDWVKMNRSAMKAHREQITAAKARIHALKWVLES